MRHTDSWSKRADEEIQREEGTRAGETRRLAIFRVHSVAKPQLTALLGSYSSRPLAFSLPYLLLLFRSLLPSRSSSRYRLLLLPSGCHLYFSPCTICRLSSRSSLLYHIYSLSLRLYLIFRSPLFALFFYRMYSCLRFLFLHVCVYYNGCLWTSTFSYANESHNSNITKLHFRKYHEHFVNKQGSSFCLLLVQTPLEMVL